MMNQNQPAAIHVEPTSNQSARLDDIILRETGTTRLVFRPKLVVNSQNPECNINGIFLYQRKGPNDEWTEVPNAGLHRLKKGEGYSLELHAAELAKLKAQLDILYPGLKDHGIPSEPTKYVPLDSHLASLARVSQDGFESLAGDDPVAAGGLLQRFLHWIASSQGPTDLIETLAAFDPTDLAAFQTAAKAAQLRTTIETLKGQLSTGDEEFWQNNLASHSFLLEQIFHWPITIAGAKCYVGGKSYTNRGGSVVDFLIRNSITHNVGLVEIKTPQTPLLMSQSYRAGVWAPSRELSGSVVQVLAYRASLLQEFMAIGRGAPDLEAFAPTCTIIIGSTHGLDHDRRKCFELYRTQLADVEVITYDELLERANRIVLLLSLNQQADFEEEGYQPEDFDEDSLW